VIYSSEKSFARDQEGIMGKYISAFALAALLIAAVSVLAADKVVVVPLMKTDPNLKPENIRYGVTIKGVTGTLIPLLPYGAGTVTSAEGRIWMDRNLGASRVATSSTDSEAYGDLYQWGRLADGHENRVSSTTTTLSSTDIPGHSTFIIGDTDTNFDWRSPQNDNLWQGASGINNPCPPGFRLPTHEEWNTERASWSSNDAVGAFASPLKLPLAGGRLPQDGSLLYVGTSALLWSSTTTATFPDKTSSDGMTIDPSDVQWAPCFRGSGLSVRCIMD
jgi:uncharacterized protein (TIGR02145 family)